MIKKMADIQNQPTLTDLSHELLCHIFQFLPLKETLSVSLLCRKLLVAVEMHLRLRRIIDFCEGKIYGYMPSSITDDHMHSLLKKCRHVETIYGLHPIKVERRRLRKRSALTVPGIIEALSLCPNLCAIETSDLRLLEAILQHLPQLEIIGHFRNRNGIFPPHASQRLKLQQYSRISSLHLIGVEVPELTAMPYLQHLHLHCVRFTKLQPFRGFLAQNLQTFVMRHCMGPSMSLRYLSLIIALSSSPSLSRLELVRVPLPGGLFQRAVEDSYRHNGFVNLKVLVIAGCKGLLEADLGHLMIVASKNLQNLSIQPSLTKDSLFVSLQFAQCEFPKLKNLHLGYVDKFNASGEWSNDVLLTLGLAEIPDTPSSLTDSGMKVISELFPYIKNLAVSNCPHLMAMDQWYPGDGAESWKELTDLTLQRCHCLQLSSFEIFLKILPKIQVVILNDMFREPPKGCSHVGLSAGTGLGMSSAVVSNQDEHIAVQGHQQDFEPQVDEQLENDEFENYFEGDDEEPHVMVLQEDFYDQHHSIFHPTPPREEMDTDGFPAEQNLQNIPADCRREQNLGDSVENQDRLHNENESGNLINDNLDISQPSTSSGRRNFSKKKKSRNNSSSSFNENDCDFIKVNLPCAKKVYKRKCKMQRGRKKSSLLHCDSAASDENGDGVTCSRSNNAAPAENQNFSVSHSEHYVDQSGISGRHNVHRSVSSNVSEYYDPFQPSTSKAGNYCDYSDSDSETALHAAVCCPENKLNKKRRKKMQERRNTDALGYKKVRKSNAQDNKLNKACLPQSTDAAVSDEVYMKSEVSSMNEVICSGSYGGPVTRQREKMLSSGISPQSTFYSKKVQKNNTKRYEKKSTKCLQREMRATVSSTEKGSNSSMLTDSSQRDKMQFSHNSVPSYGNQPMHIELQSTAASSTYNPQNASYDFKNSYNNATSSKKNISAIHEGLPVPVKSEPCDSFPESNDNICPNHYNLNERNPNASVSSTVHQQELERVGSCADVLEGKDFAVRRRKRHLRKTRTKKCPKLESSRSSERLLNKNQEKIISNQEEFDTVSQGTQATSADIRRSLKRQKQSSKSHRRRHSHRSRRTYVRHSKISEKQKHRRYKPLKNKQELHNKTTSTSDPLLEDDVIQTLHVESETLISLSIISCGISDVVVDQCQKLTHIEVQACRILKKVQLNDCSNLRRLNVSQCPKLNVKDLIPEILSLHTHYNLLVSYEPCMQGYHRADVENAIFSKATLDQSIILFHDFTDTSRENTQAVFRENINRWMDYVQNMYNLSFFQRTKQKGKKTEITSKSFPWGHDLRRIYGHYVTPSPVNHPASEWHYQILTNNHLFTVTYEFVNWTKGFGGPDLDDECRISSLLLYDTIKGCLQMHKRIIGFYVPVME